MVVDEELGMEGASGKEAIPSTTVTVPSTNETGDDIVSLHRRILTVIINTIVNVCMLSIDLSVSRWYALSWLWFQTDRATQLPSFH